MPNYQIKLTPVDTYFFGGEKHKLESNQLKADYFVESNLYPQQTTLLGMLRYYLLFRDENLLNKNSNSDARKKATELIGNKSFAYNGANQFGKIQSISPLYFLHQSKPYFFAPFDYNFNYKEGSLTNKDGKAFNAKEHYSRISKQQIINGKEPKEISAIIKDVDHTGNKKAKSGKSQLEGYYKMTKKKLDEGWSFAFDAAIDLDTLDREANYVHLGGEKSIFKTEFKKIAHFNKAILPKKYVRTGSSFIYFTSDAFIKNEDLKAVDFAVNQFVSFRCMQSSTETANYNNLPKQRSDKGILLDKKEVIKKGLFRSCRNQLIKRGSVFYLDANEKDKLAETLKNTPVHKFGFNHYLKN